ncbi:xanthine dehydrogenase family protein molybdopterin-binding subunit [Desulfitobacterium sp.]|uniref:xanthine dehydrogenase family protein molybdopterin-binding subunit n=1 Tax=Desulfitobacterium sp. TaxID=49981 RepID=UPI002B20A4FA|nr:xanthine dehydrogenase family protein molybdopterin-binding subunit [Desulfitobacterium sp.]MEA4900006.1 xanthine dehydrogenase family protein molybdopterin-binding subunit [Desulfitobacterium sp.]
MSKIIGSSLPRIDGIAKVTGKACYPSDYSFPNMLYLKLVRATEAHANILSIDIHLCQGVEGVYCFTADDVYENSYGSIIKDQPVFAKDKVRFYGEPLALIAADTLEKANYYAQLVKVSYEPLAVVDDPVEALKEGSPKLHKGGNLLAHIPFTKGEPEQAFRESFLVLEDDFQVPVVDHLYLERESGVSYLDEQGVLTLIAGTQNPFYDREEISRCLGIPLDKVRVHSAIIGGGFGGKDGITVQLFLALVTQKTSLPAKLVFSREESLGTSYKRHAAKIHIKVGFEQSGRITAYQATIYFDTGAYAALGPAVLGLGIEHASGPYEIPNVSLDGYLSYTNKPAASAMRGFGAPQTSFAMETLLNRAAKILEIDPIQLRYRNALYKGAEGCLGHTIEYSAGLKEALALLGKSPLWREQAINTDPLIGYGMAAGYLSCGMGKGLPDHAKVEVESLTDGTYVVKIGTVEIGQGSNTLFVQLAAETLQVSPDRIKVIMGDTALTHESGSTAASRTSYICGNALLKAVEDLKRQRKAGISYPIGIGESVFPEVKKSDLGIGLPHSMYTFIVQAAKVRVLKTGEIELLDVYAVTEAGRVINPMALEGQIQGGIIMGIGYALSEKLEFIEGIPKNLSLASYLIPTCLDSPAITAVHVTEYEESGPMGLKGAGEVGTVVIAPAIAAAVSSVVGRPITELPISREKLVLN